MTYFTGDVATGRHGYAILEYFCAYDGRDDPGATMGGSTYISRARRVMALPLTSLGKKAPLVFMKMHHAQPLVVHVPFDRVAFPAQTRVIHEDNHHGFLACLHALNLKRFAPREETPPLHDLLPYVYGCYRIDHTSTVRK